jgi:hypothetical protein
MHQLTRMGVAGASGKGIDAVASASGSFACTALGQVAELGTRHHLVVHVVANGSASTAEVWFDAQLLYSSNKVGTGDTTQTSVQLGAGHPRQMGAATSTRSRSWPGKSLGARDTGPANSCPQPFFGR